MANETRNTIGKGRGVAFVMASAALALATAFRSLSDRFRELGAELNLA